MTTDLLYRTRISNISDGCQGLRLHRKSARLADKPRYTFFILNIVKTFVLLLSNSLRNHS
jgi:hypothetical protein